MNRINGEYPDAKRLDWGYSLGLTASHSDVLDYRCMLARVRHMRNVRAARFEIECRGELALIVQRELLYGESHRYSVEAVWGGPLA